MSKYDLLASLVLLTAVRMMCKIDVNNISILDVAHCLITITAVIVFIVDKIKGGDKNGN